MCKPSLAAYETIYARVRPKASRNRIVWDKSERGTRIARIYVTAAPTDGKANDAVLKILAKALGLPKTSLETVRGTTSRDKTIRCKC